jgi:hypothetical protein
MDLSFFIVLAVAQAQSPFVSPEPTFGLTNAYGWIGYRYYGRSSDGRFLIRNGGDAPYHHFNNLPYSIDCTTGVVARLDLTQQGELPSAFVGGGTWDTAIIAMSGDTRFLVFLSTSASYADAPSTPDPTALYWLDRDSDEDSIFDEIDGRRVVCIIPEPGFQPPDYSDSDFGDISDDGRHFTYFVNSTGPHRADIWITDLDADENGILAEPGTIAKYPISGSTDDGQFYTPSVRPTISGDGRYVAFEKWAEPAFVNIRVGAGYIFVYDYPPGHPFTRRPMLFDRDSDEDGRYDELGATELRDLGPDVGYSEYSSWTQTVVSGSGREVLSIVSRANMGVYGHSLGRTLVAFDIRSGTSTSLAPSHAYGVDSNPIQFVVDQDARRVFTTTVTSSTPLLPYAPYDNWFISIDRDTDSDGVFDEPESSRTTTLTLPNYQVAWVPVLDPSGHHLRVTLYDTPTHVRPRAYRFRLRCCGAHGSGHVPDRVVETASPRRLRLSASRQNDSARTWRAANRRAFRIPFRRHGYARASSFLHPGNWDDRLRVRPAISDRAVRDRPSRHTPREASGPTAPNRHRPACGDGRRGHLRAVALPTHSHFDPVTPVLPTTDALPRRSSRRSGIARRAR